jgi:primase-polymerase (primpol)-like protein
VLCIIALFFMAAERPYAERAAAYAETLSKRFQTGILKSMQGKPLWGLYRMEKDDGGHWHKRPYQPSGKAASKNNLQHWNSLDTVLEALAQAKFPVSGIGILLPVPFILIDLDARDTPIYDKEKKKIVSPLALRIMQAVPTYFELSPNFGLHGILEGRPLRGNFKTEHLEMYTNWFSTVTTRHIPGTPLDVTNQQEAIEALENEFHPPVPARLVQNTGGSRALRGCLNCHRKPQTIQCYKNF